MGNLSYPDPAERGLFMRLLYRDWKPTLLGRWVGRLMIWWNGLSPSPGIVAVLEVKDSASRQKSTVPLVVTTVDDKQYLVSMLGPGSNWIKNVEAANGEAVLHHGRPRSVRLVAIAPNERAPILKEYVRIATSGRKHIPLAVDAPLSEFQKIADRYPVYRINPVNLDPAAVEGRHGLA
jgi:hypothetical protein